MTCSPPLKSLVVTIEGLTSGTEKHTCKSGGLLPSDSEALNMHSCVQGLKVVRETVVRTLQMCIIALMQCAVQVTTQACPSEKSTTF